MKEVGQKWPSPSGRTDFKIRCFTHSNVPLGDGTEENRRSNYICSRCCRVANKHLQSTRPANLNTELCRLVSPPTFTCCYVNAELKKRVTTSISGLLCKD